MVQNVDMNKRMLLRNSAINKFLSNNLTSLGGGFCTDAPNSFLVDALKNIFFAFCEDRGACFKQREEDKEKKRPMVSNKNIVDSSIGVFFSLFSQLLGFHANGRISSITCSSLEGVARKTDYKL